MNTLIPDMSGTMDFDTTTDIANALVVAVNFAQHALSAAREARIAAVAAEAKAQKAVDALNAVISPTLAAMGV